LHNMTDEQVLSKDYFDYVINVFKLNYKINEFVNRVIDHV